MPAATSYIEFIRDLPVYEQVEVVSLVYKGVPVEKAVNMVLRTGYSPHGR